MFKVGLLSIVYYENISSQELLQGGVDLDIFQGDRFIGKNKERLHTEM